MKILLNQLFSLSAYALAVIAVISPPALSQESSPPPIQIAEVPDATPGPSPSQPPEQITDPQDAALQTPEQPAVPVPSMLVPPAPTQIASLRFDAFNSIPQIWASIQDAAVKQDLRTVHDQVRALREKSLIAGVYNLENYALRLIEFGEERLRVKDPDSAALYSRKAHELAPDSPIAILRGLHLSNRTHTGEPWKLIKRAFHGFLDRSDLVVYAVHILTYPVLWALTLGAYIILVLQIVAAPVRLLQGLKDSLPVPMPSLLGPIAFIAILLLPLAYGVLSCLFVWSLLITLLIPGRKWLGLTTGTILALWGVVVPIQENHQLFLKSPGGEALMRAFSDSYIAGDESLLGNLVRSDPQSGPAIFSLASTLKRKGDLEAADKLFKESAALLPHDETPAAEQGTILFLKGDLRGAMEQYEQAEKRGAASPEFFFNLSKLKFEAVDTAASKFYLEQAERLDPVRTRIFREREELFGEQARYALADMRLPLQYLWKVMKMPILETRQQVDSAIGSLAPPVGPIGIVLCGVLLMAAGYFSSNRSKTDYYRTERIKSRESKFSVLLRIVPGGSCVVGERPALGVLIAAIAVFLIFPMVEWPTGSGMLLTVFTGIYPYYVGLVVLYILICPWIGYEED